MMDSNDWNKRYQDHQTGWDIGYANPVLVRYVLKHFPDKQTRILIPGAGRAYEAEALWKAGYTQVFPCDFAPLGRDEMLQRVPDFPTDNYILADFFSLKGPYDLIVEQTFFCAIDPVQRKAYADKMHELLGEQGILAGLLFEMDKADGPPFGGHREEYTSLFSPDYHILKMDDCQDSIPPRMGRELFIELRPKGPKMA